jgi:hypothetical protein
LSAKNSRVSATRGIARGGIESGGFDFGENQIVDLSDDSGASGGSCLRIVEVLGVDERREQEQGD